MPESFRGRDVTVTALGQSWTFSRWTRNVLDDFNDWARTQLPNPIEVAEAAVLRYQDKQREVAQDPKLSAADKKHRIDGYQEMAERVTKQAMDKACSYLAMTSPEYKSLVNSALGMTRLFWLLLRKAHPDIDETTVFEIIRDLPDDDKGRIMRITAGTSGGEGNAPAPAESK